MALPSQNLYSPDGSQVKKFIVCFKALPEKSSTTVRFFDRADYYTLHGEDAVSIAKDFFKTTSFLKTYKDGEESLPTLVLNKANFEAVVRNLLLVKHYRVEVFVRKNVSKDSWTLEFRGSPGNLTQFEDLLFENSDKLGVYSAGSAVMAIKVASDTNEKVKITGIALVDCAEQKMSVCEFPDNEYHSNAEALMVQLSAKECLVMNESVDLGTDLKKVVTRSGLMATERKKQDFFSDNLGQDLNLLVKFKKGQQENAMALPQMNMKVATSALASIIKYLDLTCNEENLRQFTLQTIQYEKFIHIDYAAVQALNLFPPTYNSASLSSAAVFLSQRCSSVWGLLDRCRTSHGRRLLARWIRQPLRDLNIIKERHDVVEALCMHGDASSRLHEEHLRRIPDFQTLARKLQRNKASMQDLYRVYQGVGRLPSLIQALQSYTEVNVAVESVFITPLQEQFEDLKKYLEMIETTLDMDSVNKGEFLVSTEFDDDLKEMRLKMDDLESKMNSQLSKVARDLGFSDMKSIKLEQSDQFGHCFRVTLKDAKKIHSGGDYETLDTHKGGVKFRNGKMRQLSQDYREIHNEYNEHQKSIVAEIMEISRGYCNSFQLLSTILAKLDVLTSFSVVSTTAPSSYVRPEMMEFGHGTLSLTNVRHACLEMQENVSFVPNDVHFKQGECTLHVITGPNMGGKSTYIRSVGVAALLAHIGMFVPCERAEIPILDAILARVGANDAQTKGMSTFMVEMVETSSIIRRANENSLVIIDELGRGTSTYEGCGIASAIVRHLAKDLKSFALFATHFHELTLLSKEIPTIRNSHVSAITSQDTLTHLYRVKDGACDQSFGIHVAQMAHFPKRVTQAAKLKLAELDETAANESNPIAKMAEFIAACLQVKEKLLTRDELKAEVERLKLQFLPLK